MEAPAFGLDFGTTNSSIALVDAAGRSRLATFEADDGPTETFRSVLYFDHDDGRCLRGSGPAERRDHLIAQLPANPNLIRLAFARFAAHSSMVDPMVSEILILMG